MRFLVTLLLSVATIAFLCVHGQLQTGFISIDCGSTDNFNYVDIDTQISYTSDRSFIDTGTNRNISSEYAYPNNPTLASPLSDVRSFPQRDKNCYTLRPTGGRNSLNLIRALFMYGNYDGQNRLPVFDLYVDASLWLSVNFRNASDVVSTEIIVVALTDTISICLINIGQGTPFISALELRPLNGSVYNIQPGSSGSLVLFQRLDTGFTEGTGRYTDDIYDRIWSPYSSPSWDSVTTSADVDVSGNGYRAPSVVIKTAARPRNSTASLELTWTTSDSNAQFYVYLYFAELEVLRRNQSREFNVSWNGNPLFGPLIPRDFDTTTVYNSRPLVGSEHHLSLFRTGNSTLPPILNAIEIFIVRQSNASLTFSNDGDAINDIKTTYQVNKNWVGDPCGPRNYSWEGLICRYNDSNPPRIISINLTGSGLNGEIAASVARLSLLESLDLSNNSLTGTIPEFLQEMSALKFLNLEGNQFSGAVPRALLARSRDGSLTLRVDSQHLCDSGSCNGNERNIIVPIVVPLVVVLVLIVILFFVWRIRRKGKSEKAISDGEGIALPSKKKQFTYAEVVGITDDFQIAIGKGGFGTVYLGQLKDGSKVAVKLLSSSSSQGSQEFQNEAELLMTVHHRNLASFVGYCDEGNKMALIYDYMANGNLKDYMSDNNAAALSWEMRLRIAIDSAQGLEYLHHGCRPPIIHRDVKTANILLSDRLDAKIADFGLSKGLPTDGTSHILVPVVGTTGYLDPEYYVSHKLNEKSDVYSFGIVLLELITGQPAIIKNEEHLHIIQYVTPFLEKGEIESIIDQRLGGDFDLNSVWKFLEVAMACTTNTSVDRADMGLVLTELKECLEMELGRGGTERVTNPRRESRVTFIRSNQSSDVFSQGFESMTRPSAR